MLTWLHWWLSHWHSQLGGQGLWQTVFGELAHGTGWWYWQGRRCAVKEKRGSGWSLYIGYWFMEVKGIYLGPLQKEVCMCLQVFRHVQQVNQTKEGQLWSSGYNPTSFNLINIIKPKWLTKKKQYAYSHTYLSSFCLPFHVKLIFTFLFFILTEFSGVLQHGHLCRLKKEERGRKKRMDWRTWGSEK